MKSVRKDYYLDESAGMRKGKKKREGVFSGLLILVLGIVILILAFILLFHIQKIEVTGTQYCTESEVISWLKKDKYASNSLYVWVKYNYTDVKQLPLVEASEISMKNPWTIQVRIYEKSIIGYLEVSGQYLYFDKDGTVILLTDQESVEGVPKIEGIPVALSEVKAHEQLPVEDKEIFSVVLEVTKEVQNCKLTPDRILFENEDVTLEFGNITVLLGQNNMDEKIAQISPILEKLQEKFPDTAGTLHLEQYSSVNRTISFIPDKPEDDPEASDADDSGDYDDSYYDDPYYYDEDYGWDDDYDDSYDPYYDEDY